MRAALAGALDAGAESVAVCCCTPTATPIHERLVAEIAAEVAPDVPVTLASEVLARVPRVRARQHRRDERLRAAGHGRYLGGLRPGCARDGFNGALSVMQSSGGILPAEAAGRQAIRTLLSGPAAGVIGAAAIARRSGLRDVITIDMGGTSTDVALLRDGRPTLTTESKIDGLPFVCRCSTSAPSAPAAARSRASTSGGLLDVGPQSAGAVPGPACYGRGGALPTVTDANVVLGLLRPAHFLGGEMPLDVALAHTAVTTLGLADDAREAAAQIVRVVDANMTQAIRLVSTERGLDPAGYALVPYGGAGPLHACSLAAALGIRRVLVPPFPGLLSAWGLLVADLVVDVAQTAITTRPDATELAKRFAELGERLHGQLGAQGLPAAGWDVEATLDMRYRGQAYELAVPVKLPAPEPADLTTRFHAQHAARYGNARPNDPVQAVTYRLRASHPVPSLTVPPPPTGGDPTPAYADVTLDSGSTRVAFYDRATLPVGADHRPCV